MNVFDLDEEALLREAVLGAESENRLVPALHDFAGDQLFLLGWVHPLNPNDVVLLFATLPLEHFPPFHHLNFLNAILVRDVAIPHWITTPILLQIGIHEALVQSRQHTQRIPLEHQQPLPGFIGQSLTKQLPHSVRKGRGKPNRYTMLKALCDDHNTARNFAAFWILGVLNNAGYVVMLALAQEILSGGVGIVFFFDIFPAIIVKATAPYWFHVFPYSMRMWTVAALMSAGFACVALGQTPEEQLLGVIFASIQSGLGEVSCLALCSFYDSKKMITAWSSGTGFAGVGGFCWVMVLHKWVGLPAKTLLLLSMIFSGFWLLNFFVLLRPPKRIQKSEQDFEEVPLTGKKLSSDGYPDNSTEARDVDGLPLTPANGSQEVSTPKMPLNERVHRTLMLWPYMVPLLVVYFAEYAMQSGTWAAIGFPVDSKTARNEFYSRANWAYQAGVFVSRSSGMLFQANRPVLWAMPVLQVVLLFFFYADAATHFWYNNGLIVLCFVVGLLGGAVYVNAFTLLSKEVEPRYVEFSLTAASLADSFGITLADLAGIFIQGCLYKTNGLSGAVYKC
ncbi:hypothetical protein BSKO_00348 [Bryopsis sp. KO-2023]|nr:hypothetical protein BSKO_00348 [Bryopsis sp. KO-2023]